MALDIPLPTQMPEDDPAQYIPLLLSAIEGFLLMPDVWTPATYPDARQYMEQLKKYVVDCFGKCSEPMIYQTLFGVDPAAAKLIVGGALAPSFQNTQYNGGGMKVTPIAIQNELEYEFLAPAGNVTFFITGAKSTNFAIVQYSIVGQAGSSTFDWYAAAFTPNIVASFSFTLATSGLHKLRMKANNKNNSSSNYDFMVSAIVVKAP